MVNDQHFLLNKQKILNLPEKKKKKNMQVFKARFWKGA